MSSTWCIYVTVSMVSWCRWVHTTAVQKSFPPCRVGFELEVWALGTTGRAARERGVRMEQSRAEQSRAKGLIAVPGNLILAVAVIC